MSSVPEFLSIQDCVNEHNLVLESCALRTRKLVLVWQIVLDLFTRIRFRTVVRGK